MNNVVRRIIWFALCCVLGLIGGVAYLYVTQDFYPDSIKIVAITILFGIFSSQSRAPGVLLSEVAVAFVLFTFLPSNASLLENPSTPTTYVTRSIALINSGWSTFNGFVLYLNPQYACEATKGAVAWEISRQLNLEDGAGKNPEDYEVTNVIPNGSDEIGTPKPNAVCMVSLKSNEISVREFRVVTSSQGYNWDEVKS